VLGAAPAPRSEDAFVRLRFVIGDVSTTLLTARWLVPDVCCISLARPLQMLDSALEALFTTVGVRLPEALAIS
jgi:hypothetical protein